MAKVLLDKVDLTCLAEIMRARGEHKILGKIGSLIIDLACMLIIINRSMDSFFTLPPEFYAPTGLCSPRRVRNCGKLLGSPTKSLPNSRKQSIPIKLLLGINKGFDFLGYNFNGVSLKPAVETIQRLLEKILQLYENKTLADIGKCLADYLRRSIVVSPPYYETT